MSTWQTFPTNIPADLEYCWIRLNYYYGLAFLAQWILSAENFVSVDNSINYPAWTVAKWESINPALVFGVGQMHIGINFFVS